MSARRGIRGAALFGLALLLLAVAACQPLATATQVQVFGTVAALPTVPAAVPVTFPPTFTPTPTITMTPTPTATPTATPFPKAVLWQLTDGGCCVRPFWSPDGSQVWYIDKPSADAAGGIWGVDVARDGPRLPEFISGQLGIYSPDGSLVAFPEGQVTYIVRPATGERWAAGNGGRSLVFSPDSQQIAWQASSSQVNFDVRQTSIWVADSDGGNAREITRLAGGGLVSWFPDGEYLLISGRDSDAGQGFLARLSLADGSITMFVQSPGLRSTTLDPAGEWVAYMVVFSGDSERDGLWVARVDGSFSAHLDVFGAYHWRAGGQLLVVPQRTLFGSHQFLVVDAATRQSRVLTDPARLPLRIAGGDWALAADGARVVFVSAEDRNLWVVALPP